MARLDGKVAIITGASNGLRGQMMGFGGAAAWMFSSEGANVIITDINDEVGEQTASQLREDGCDAVYLHHDVTSEPEWQRVVEATLDRYGKLDVLVNNAGGGGGGGLIRPDSPLDAFQKTMDLNSTGTFLGIRSVIEPMDSNGGGSIVNVSSIYGIVGGHAPPGYFASKGAVRTLTKAAAVQLAPKKIRVNSVHPGFAMTAATQERFSIPEEAAPRLSRVPMGRFATADDVAHAIVYLASEESSWVTGVELAIDGGLTAM